MQEPKKFQLSEENFKKKIILPYDQSYWHKKQFLLEQYNKKLRQKKGFAYQLDDSVRQVFEHINYLLNNAIAYMVNMKILLLSARDAVTEWLNNVDGNNEIVIDDVFNLKLTKDELLFYRKNIEEGLSAINDLRYRFKKYLYGFGFMKLKKIEEYLKILDVTEYKDIIIPGSVIYEPKIELDIEDVGGNYSNLLLLLDGCKEFFKRITEVFKKFEDNKFFKFLIIAKSKNPKNTNKEV